MVGRGAHVGKAGGVVYALIHGERLERCESLVVVHGKDAVKLLVGFRAEESVGSVGSEGEYLLVAGLFDCRYYYITLLGAEQSVLAGMGI